MLHINSSVSRFKLFIVFLGTFLLAAQAASDSSISVFSPAVNGEALRGLSTIESAEPMGAGRITFSILAPWYQQRVEYLHSPNLGTNVFTGSGAFSYGVNSNVDLFASVSGFGLSSYTRNETSSGLGTIRAGAQGSLPFPWYSFVRMGGQMSIIGGTSQNQINTYRADGYNFFETSTGYDFSGKLMQTMLAGSEDYGIKFHLNEGGALRLNNGAPSLLLLGAGLQGNLGMAVFGLELNSRTEFNDLAFGTDPLWFTPSIHIRTPYDMNAMAGVDISLSEDRSSGLPRALEPYRVFASLAFSLDLLAGRRNAELSRKHKAEQDKIAADTKADQSAKLVQSLTVKAANDSASLVDSKRNGVMQMDSMQRNSDKQTLKATADSLALVQAAANLAEEKSKRSEAEKQLLSKGELLLDAVYFKTNETIISINSKPYLNIIGKMLLKYPKLQIEVAGYTDNTGSAEYNLALSQGRAESVRNYLTQAEPALLSKLNSQGYGITMPKADNATKEGRLTNRRVELRVINMDALQQYSQR